MAKIQKLNGRKFAGRSATAPVLGLNLSADAAYSPIDRPNVLAYEREAINGRKKAYNKMLKETTQTKYVTDERTTKIYGDLCQKLGVNYWHLWCSEGEASAGLIFENGKLPVDIARRQNLAREAFRNTSSELESYMDEYRKISDKTFANSLIRKRVECLACGESYVGRYKVCAPCIDVYLKEIIGDMPADLNSCDALRILDGVSH